MLIARCLLLQITSVRTWTFAELVRSSLFRSEFRQQKLMRHSQVSTTMNVCGNALMEEDLNQRPLGYFQ
jgi:hypothetical protein